jgi:hypothetical protein
MPKATDPEILTEQDLSDEQRAWMPASGWEAYGQWPACRKAEVVDDALAFYAGASSWDYRSVAVAARAYPGWRIQLWGSHLLVVTRAED